MDVVEQAIQSLFTQHYLRVSLNPNQIPGFAELSQLEIKKEWDGSLLRYGTVLRFNDVYSFGTPLHMVYLLANEDMPGRHVEQGLFCSKADFDEYIKSVEKTLIQVAYFAELCRKVHFFGTLVPQLVDFGVEDRQFKFIVRLPIAKQILSVNQGAWRQIKAQYPRLCAAAEAGRSSRLEIRTLGQDLQSSYLRRRLNALPRDLQIGPMQRKHLWSWWK